MVQEWKIKLADEIAEEIKKYRVVGLVDAYKLPSKQFQEIKHKIRDKVKIRVVKKRVLLKALEKANVSDKLKEAVERVIIPGVLLTNDNPFRVYKFISKNKSPTFAKAGDIAPRDIIVPAGNTGLPPGPVIGELKSAGIKAKIEGNSIVVTEDSLIVREGEVIDEKKANILMKLNIQPMEIGINVIGMEEEGILYTRDILEVDEKEYVNKIVQAYNYAFNLAYHIDYFIPRVVEMKIKDAYIKAINLGVNATILEKGVIDKIIQKAYSNMMSLASTLPEDARGNIDIVVNTPAAASPAQGEQKEESKEEKKEEKEDKGVEEAAAGLGALFG